VSVFADSSALVKLYADEIGHEQIRALSPLIISQLARVEVPSAIWRKQRMGELSHSDAHLLVREFEADYHGDGEREPRFAVVAADAMVLDNAARLVAVHGLRAFDAVQLSSACLAADVDPDCDHLAAFDDRLRSAAITEGFLLLPPGD
jgi:uncharacterized protein